MFLFTGNSPYLIDEAVQKWKHQFIEKYGDFNCIHIRNLEKIERNTLAETLLSQSFLAEKKLIIIDIDNDLKEEYESFFRENLENIPSENILLFSFKNPDKRKTIYKELKNIAEVKEFNLGNDADTLSYFKKKYKGQIDTNALSLLIKYKGNNSQKISSEIEKLLITKDFIHTQDIENIIMPELEENIFLLIDSILAKDIFASLNHIEIILGDTNIYAFYNSLLANLRIHLYIMQMKDANEIDIGGKLGLGNRAFLANKNYRIQKDELKKFYLNLIQIDKKMKSGKLLGSEENDIRLEIEKNLLKIHLS